MKNRWDNPFIHQFEDFNQPQSIQKLNVYYLAVIPNLIWTTYSCV